MVFYGGELFAWHHFGGRPITDDAELERFWDDLGAGLPDDRRRFDLDLFADLEHPRSLYAALETSRSGCVGCTVNTTAALFRRIREFTGAATVVDSSHFPLRALALDQNPDVDLRVVHLVRDPRDVVNALQNAEQRRGTPMRPLVADVYCWVVLVLSRALMALVPAARTMTMRYEDLVADPQRELDRVCALLELPRARLDFERLAVGRIFQGNRLRHQPVVAIREQPSRRRLSRCRRADDQHPPGAVGRGVRIRDAKRDERSATPAKPGAVTSWAWPGRGCGSSGRTHLSPGYSGSGSNLFWLS
ncbi:MAG: sulfotransferase [Acidimicrobiia bacterium]|nr:sulfotransferase [Acidimicrobiia bacterium]